MDINTLLMNLEDVVSDGFARYSKYIIQDRAIPDARDGLKPVQRRILYAMYKEGNYHNRPYRKSAKSVGVIIGNYHPHGDTSIYDSMVRLSQDFKMNYPLVDMHGNNGSVDGDSAAAMRYTEARLSAISMLMLENVDKNTVAFAPNFDDTELEPVVLPAYYPNLLVNGSTGISAGYATEIPSHNLAEVIDATIFRIKNPTSRLDSLMKYIKGPDFPTGGVIQGQDQIKKAYQTGRGRIVVRAKHEIEVDKLYKVIKITQLPYDVNKAELVKKLEEIKYDKVIDGIVNVRDESDRHGLRVVIELKKNIDEQLVLNYLYKNTNLQIYYNFNMVAIVNKTPKLMNLMQILDTYIDHQKDVLINKTNYELDLSQKRLHILEGLIKAVKVIDKVITLIRKSQNRSDAVERLMERFSFTKVQAEAIVDLRLYRLSNTDIKVLKDEHEKLLAYIEKLSLILSNTNVLNEEIIANLEAVKNDFARERLTVIEEDIEDIVIDKEALVQEQEVMLSISLDGYIKRSSIRSYQSSQEEMMRKSEDFILSISKASTLDRLIVFFDNGLYAYIPVYTLQETRWKDMGKHISNYVDGISDSKVIKAILIKDFNNDNYFTTLTKEGMIKQTKLDELELTRYTKAAKYINLKKEDQVVSVIINDLSEDVILLSRKGYALRYALENVSPTSIRSAGVKAMRLVDDELASAVSCATFTDDFLYLVLEDGSTKRMKITEIEIGNRTTKGTLLLKAKKIHPAHILDAYTIARNDDIFVFDNNHDVTKLKAFDTNISAKQEGLKKSVSHPIISSTMIHDLTINATKPTIGSSSENQNDSEVDFITKYDSEQQISFDDLMDVE